MLTMYKGCLGCGSGLPDGLFSNQNSKFWSNLEGLGMENVVIFFDHLEYFTAIWYNLWPFVIVCGNLAYFNVLVYLDQEKSGNPGADQIRKFFGFSFIL
jgi:hypothetical protein